MEINEMNYEMYALDYAEGNLAGEQLDAMESFLSQHPELKEEIASIFATQIPVVETRYAQLESLKKSKRFVPLWVMPMSSAAAAVLVVALGLLWFMSGKAVYGELATSQPAFTIHYSIEHTYREIPIDQPAQSTKSDKILIQAVQQFAGNENNPSNQNSTQDAFINETSLNTEVEFADALPSNSEEVPFKVKFKILEPVEVASDDYFILPVTIQLHDLSMKGAREARSIQENLAELEAQKDARRKNFREGALSLIQQTLMPEGVNNLLSN